MILVYVGLTYHILASFEDIIIIHPALFADLFSDSLMQGFGISEILLKFLDSYLSPRVGNVVVQGQHSVDMVLDNTVFQGTVLGPSLWNSFFSDVSVPAKSTGGRESMFADDLNVFQEFDRSKNLVGVQNTLQQCRENVHK